jgi:hypothetical protein
MFDRGDSSMLPHESECAHAATGIVFEQRRLSENLPVRIES